MVSTQVVTTAPELPSANLEMGLSPGGFMT